MKTWHAVAFLIVTARGRAGEPVSPGLEITRQWTPYAAGNSLGHLSPRAIHKW